MNAKDLAQTIQEITTSLIAMIVIGGYLGLYAYATTHGEIFQEPPGLGILVGAVAGTYFGKVLAINGARQAGTAAAQTAMLNVPPPSPAPPAPGSVVP